MEVTKNQIDDLNIELTIALKAEDYAEQEKKRLSAYRRNADFKGFRKGMVPASLVKKVYGDQALYEAINGVVSEQLDKFIKDNNAHIMFFVYMFKNSIQYTVMFFFLHISISFTHSAVKSIVF